VSPAIVVAVYYGLIPLAVITVSWLIVRRDYGTSPEAD